MQLAAAWLVGMLLIAGPAIAQDGTPIIDPAQWAIDKTTRDGVMRKLERDRGRAGASAYARSNARSASRTAQTCANGVRMRAQGNRNPGLVRLARLCRQAGY